MFTVIFGRPGCPYCVRATELAEKLTAERDDFNFRYIDIHAEGFTKADLEKTVGKPVETVCTSNNNRLAVIVTAGADRFSDRPGFTPPCGYCYRRGRSLF